MSLSLGQDHQRIIVYKDKTSFFQILQSSLYRYSRVHCTNTPEFIVQILQSPLYKYSRVHCTNTPESIVQILQFPVWFTQESEYEATDYALSNVPNGGLSTVYASRICAGGADSVERQHWSNRFLTGMSCIEPWTPFLISLRPKKILSSLCDIRLSV